MKISLSKQEYKDLMLLASLGERVVCMDELPEDYTELQQNMAQALSSLLSYAHGFELGELVECDERGMYSLKDEPAFEMLDFLKEYDESYAFWEVSSDVLARRDMSERYTKQEWEALPPEKQFMSLLEREEWYEKEWEKHGIERLRVVEGEKKRGKKK